MSTGAIVANRDPQLFVSDTWIEGMSRTTLIKDLQTELDAADEFMQELLEADLLPHELLREYLMDLTLLQNKHIPADLCSEGKLMERTDEVSIWLENLKWEITNHQTAVGDGGSQISVLHQKLSEWNQAPKDRRITKRSQNLYGQTYLCLHNEVERLVSAYQEIPKAKQQHRRLLRDSIDNNVRRFHQYCIQQNNQFPVQHYVDIDALENGEPTVFEHVLPMSIARDLLLDNIFSIDQVFTIPTCSLGRDKDKVLKDKGWNNDTPDIYYYWKRYSESFRVDGVIQRKDGASINFAESIEDHFERSLSFLDYCKQGARN